jgi:hypothetical protein
MSSFDQTDDRALPPNGWLGWPINYDFGRLGANAGTQSLQCA